MARFLRPSPLKLSIIAFLLLFGGFIIWNVATPQEDARVVAIRQKGYPASLRELDAWYARVPDSQNAALILTNAFSQAGLADSSSTLNLIGDKSWVPERGHLLDDAARAELTAMFATNQTLLELLHSVHGLTNSRFPVNFSQGFQMLLPHLAKIKATTQLLTAEALLEVSNKDIEKALRTLGAAGCAANSIAEEPLLISQLVRIAGWGVISKRCELILNGAHLSEADLSTLQSLFHDAEGPNSMARGLGGERACGLGVFMGSDDQALVISGSGTTPAPLKERLRGALVMGLLKSTGILRKDKNLYLDVMATNIAAAEAPFPERLTLGQKATAAVLSQPSRMLIFSRMLLPALGKAMQRDAEHAARIRATQTAIAIERFRRAHNGILPGDLRELVPTYLPSPFTDPFDGKPLRFKRLGSGYVVYSIGSDLRDDGGSEPDPNKQTAKDITFVLEK